MILMVSLYQKDIGELGISPPAIGPNSRAHTDFDFPTHLFQRPGQSGWKICPGRSVSTSFAHSDT